MKVNIFKKRKTQRAKTLLDLPREEQKAIVLEAVKGANRLQENLLKRYEKTFSK